MERSIPALLERIDDFLSTRESVRWRRAAGLQEQETPWTLFSHTPELSQIDTVFAVQAQATSPRVESPRKERFEKLLRCVRRLYIESHTATGQAAHEHQLRVQPFESLRQSWTPADALAHFAVESSRDARITMERELTHHAARHGAGLGAIIEGLARAADTFKVPNAEAVLDLTRERTVATVAALAEKLLKDTDDAYRDLQAYTLKKIEPQLRTSESTLADLSRAFAVPWFVDHFPHDQLSDTLARLWGDLGLHPNAHGRIAIDSEKRQGRRRESLLFALRVPDEIRLLLPLIGGLDSWSQTLRNWAIAMHRAQANRTAPLVERMCGDDSVNRSVGLVFSSLLANEHFLKRYARMTAVQARECARLEGFRQLVAMRTAAIRLLTSRELLRRGFTIDGLNELSSHWFDSFHVLNTGGARLVFEVDPFLDDVLELDAYALEAVLTEHFTHRFNEDFFRNPSTGKWLTELAGRPVNENAATVAASLGVEKLDPEMSARRRVRVMGA